MTFLYRLSFVVACLSVAVLGHVSSAAAQPGSIAGVVTHKVTGAPLADIRVSAYTEDGTLIAQAFTSLTGEYVLSGLISRFYYVAAGKTLVEFLPEAYGCGYGCAVVQSTPVPVSPGQATSGINFTLAPPASLTGTVTAASTGQPIPYAAVVARRTDGEASSWTLTNASGAYAINNLPGGLYYIRTEGIAGYLDELYPNIPCEPGACNEAGAVPVLLTPGQTTGPIDFALAADLPNGTVSGSVRSAETNLPIAFAPIAVMDMSGLGVRGAITDGAGNFSVSVRPGTYQLRTNLGPPTHNFQNELFSEIPCTPSCPATGGTPVVVTSGATTPGIHFTVAPGVSISGVVTASGGGPIGGVPINVVNLSGAMVASSVTNSAGAYTVPVLPGTYLVETALSWNGLYADMRYGGGICMPSCTEAGGTTVTVTAGVDTNGINFALDPTAVLMGNVTDAISGVPLPSGAVQVYSSGGQLYRHVWATHGSYSLRLPVGSYYLRTLNDYGSTYRDELYNDIPCPVSCVVTSGQPVVLAAGSTTTAHFALTPGGTITGQVTRADTGATLEGVIVQALDAAGTVVAERPSYDAGVYSIPVPAGTYRVRARTPFSTTGNLSGELFNDIPCPFTCGLDAGTPVTVSPESNVGGVNFALSAGGTIQGWVQETGYGFRTDVPIYAVTTDGSGIYGGGGTGHWGLFSLNVPPGTYYLRTDAPDALNLIDEVYNDRVCVPDCDLTAGQPITVTSGGLVADIGFVLSPGGMVSGRTLDADTSAPVTDLTVEIATASGERVSTTMSWGGHFTFGGLPTGSYRIRTLDAGTKGYTNALYAGTSCADCVATMGTPVAVTAGQATTGLVLNLSRGGTLSGVVADEGGAPLTSVPVHVYEPSGRRVATRYPESAGVFTIQGLPAGTYYARTGDSNFIDTAVYINEWYGGEACTGACETPAGTPIQVSVGQTTTGVDFRLTRGATIIGAVIDAATGEPIVGDATSVRVELFTASGTSRAVVSTSAAGEYRFDGLEAGTYFIRTITTGGYIDEQFDNVVCLKSCIPAAGTPVVVATGETTAHVNFALNVGGRIAGVVTNAISSAPVAGTTVRIYAADGTWVATGSTSAAGEYTIDEGLPAGTYYARTFSEGGYLDQIYSGLTACLPGCLPTEGIPIVVTAGATTAGVNFALAPGTELIQNGGFTYGTAHWMAHATPSMAYMPWSVSSGMFEFGRVPPPPGTTNQAVVFQNTGAPVQPGGALLAQFDLGNTSTVRKRISVLLYDADFSDLSVCTFWLPPNLPPTRYAMRTRTTRLWTDATIAFYAASTNVPAGNYQVDNVSLQAPVSAVIERTDCVEPGPPASNGGVVGPDLLVNGDFSSGTTAPGWTTFGQITSQVHNGVFEFVRPAGSPAGVLLQATGQAVPPQTKLTATFALGNSSPVRKRVTVILHESDFSDLSACTFWLQPGQPLLPYTYRAFTTKAWTNATLSLYPATVGADEWIRLDDATLRVTPNTPTIGVECIEPDGGSWGTGHDVRPSEDTPETAGTSAGAVAAGVTTTAMPAAVPVPATGAGIFTVGGWIADGFEFTGDGWVTTSDTVAPRTLTHAVPIDLTDVTEAHVTLRSRLTGVDARGHIEVSLDGVTWLTADVVDASDTWVPVAVDLGVGLGHFIQIRFRLDALATTSEEPPGEWRIDDVRIDRSP